MERAETQTSASGCGRHVGRHGLQQFASRQGVPTLRQTTAAAREKAGLSQQAVGKLVGRNQRFVSHCETGQRRVDAVEFRNSCRVYGLAPSFFLDGFLGG